MNDEMMIEKQKDVADKVLSRLEAVDPYCILAGGAPMDWYLGRPAKDLDIYFYVPENRTVGAVNRQLKAALGELYNLVSVKYIREINGEDNIYKHMEHLRRIVDIEVDGIPVQLIEMKQPTFKSVVPKFPASVVMCWYKRRKDGIKGTDEFYISHDVKAIALMNNYKEKSSYIKKLKNKLKGYFVFENVDDVRKLFINRYVGGMK